MYQTATDDQAIQSFNEFDRVTDYDLLRSPSLLPPSPHHFLPSLPSYEPLIVVSILGVVSGRFATVLRPSSSFARSSRSPSPPFP